MEYISLIILIILLLTILASAVIAFIIRKDWASIVMLLSILLFTIWVVGMIYIQRQRIQMYASNNMDPSESHLKLLKAIQYLGYITIPLFIAGLIGFIRSTTSIYEKADALELENLQLSKKLNQL